MSANSASAHLGTERGDLAFQLADLALVHIQLAGGLRERAGHGLQIQLELLDPLLIELNGFLDPGDVGAELVVPALDLVEPSL